MADTVTLSTKMRACLVELALADGGTLRSTKFWRRMTDERVSAHSVEACVRRGWVVRDDHGRARETTYAITAAGRAALDA